MRMSNNLSFGFISVFYKINFKINPSLLEIEKGAIMSVLLLKKVHVEPHN